LRRCGDASLIFEKMGQTLIVNRTPLAYLRLLVLGSSKLEAAFSSGWIFHPLDDPYRLFFNNDAASSGIAENMTKFFLA